VCLALVVLWARSYWYFDWLGGLAFAPQVSLANEFRVQDGCLIESVNGVLVVLYAGNWRESLLRIATSAGSAPAHPNLRVTGEEGESAFNGFQAKVHPNGVFRGSAPHWAFVLIFGALAAAPWIKWRFSLRTLLIATTLVAVVLGAIVALR
jgi:hypothetical protein